MPQVQNIVLTDRAGTPANHTYVPVDVNSLGAFFVERLQDGSFVGEPRLVVTGTPASGSKRAKAELKLEFPVIEQYTEGGVTQPRVVDTSRVRVIYDWSPLHSASERNVIQGTVESSQKAVASQPFLAKILQGLERIFAS